MILIIFNKPQTENSLRDGTCFATLHDLDGDHLILLIQLCFSILESGVIRSSHLEHYFPLSNPWTRGFNLRLELVPP